MPQISSSLSDLVFTAWNDLSDAYAEEHMEERGREPQSLTRTTTPPTLTQKIQILGLIPMHCSL